jgi:hypothetical protein
MLYFSTLSYVWFAQNKTIMDQLHLLEDSNKDMLFHSQ